LAKAKKLHRLETLLSEWKDSGWTKPDPFLHEVNRYAYRRVFERTNRDHGHSEDIAAQTMLYVWRHISKFDPTRSSIANWVRLTTDSMLNDWLQHRYRERELIAESIDPQDIDITDDSHVFNDTSSLPDDLRTIANSLLSGYSITDTATQMGVKPATLRKRLERARNMSRFLVIDPNHSM